MDVAAVIPYQLFEKALLVLKLIRIVRLGPVLRFIDRMCEKVTYYQFLLRIEPLMPHRLHLGL